MAKLFLLSWALLMPHALSWWNAGHMVTVAIADNVINTVTESQSESLLSVFGDFFPKTSGAITSAIWMDEIHHDNIHIMDSWHFLNEPLLGKDLPQNFDAPSPDKENVVWLIKQCKKLLSDPSSEDWGRALHQRLLLHAMGDIHQPMHCISRFSKDHLQGDLGGNLFKIHDPKNPSVRNLHAYWDEGAGLFGVDGDGVNADSEGITFAKEWAEKVMKMYPVSGFSEANITTFAPDVWAQESYAFAAESYETFLLNPVVTEDLRSNTSAIVAQRIALGGYRLAYMISTINKDNPSQAKWSSSEESSPWNMLTIILMAAAITFAGVSVILLVCVCRLKRQGVARDFEGDNEEFLLNPSY